MLSTTPAGASPAADAAYRSVSALTGAGLWDQVIDEIDGRRIRVGERWFVDWASCNYLGLDLDTEIMDAIDPQVRRWGTHPSWSRMLGSPRLYPMIEERLTALLGAPDTLVLPTISQIHLSVIPALAGKGHILMDARAHRTIYDGCVHARGLGATLRRFRTEDADHLAELLREVPPGTPALVCMDGVNSMTGNTPDLRRFAAVCRESGATLYIDDAHGFGVIGEPGPAGTIPYGLRGNAIVRHYGLDYDNIVLVGGFSKAYSSMLAFIACPTPVKEYLKVAAAPYLYSGPVPTAALATVLAGLDVNERRGEVLRAELHRKTGRILDHLAELGVRTPNVSGYPLVQVPLNNAEELPAVADRLLDRGIYVTLAPYPGVPKDEVGFRIQVTAAHTDEQVDELLATLSALGTEVLRRR
ncbi:aminotransferase class I/II-fold pyridoxal phosphate-dependent enzyme [Pseudosporangium ferrugineum]|uniref:8-amino-7-oxononanoate synthase n=1 Tax=Pseudosporangium ferrugineum TaxID=439699 RepID=A0A2T0SDU9_9ACTN|nr:pyridoxal phosphate-dependent aminotransferase family protein [Pseudosporangium ferrugineum]PRY31589.1 8-amino-7-oxononanoate synthase [Pseudosporangium ferrugineum]